MRHSDDFEGRERRRRPQQDDRAASGIDTGSSACPDHLSSTEFQSRGGKEYPPEADRSQIEGEKADKFFQVIEVLKKYAVLNDDLGEAIYDELHKLRVNVWC